jgi:hypothetical protein
MKASLEKWSLESAVNKGVSVIFNFEGTIKIMVDDGSPFERNLLLVGTWS